jgi:hypothetical protein
MKDSAPSLRNICKPTYPIRPKNQLLCLRFIPIRPKYQLGRLLQIPIWPIYELQLNFTQELHVSALFSQELRVWGLKTVGAQR